MALTLGIRTNNKLLLANDFLISFVKLCPLLLKICNLLKQIVSITLKLFLSFDR